MINKYKVLFLDIDGVANSGAYIKLLDGLFDDPKNQMDPVGVARINAITDQTGAKIVVSSTWRLAFISQPNALSMLQSCMRAYGITGEVIGMTSNKVWATRNRRGKEIQEWVEDHYNEIEKFVIIDDDSDMGRMSKHHIKTMFEDGIQDSHVEQIVAILGTDPALTRP